MTNEQRVRVDRLERYLITDREKTYTTVRVNDLDTVLALIKEQQEELDKKDKQIQELEEEKAMLKRASNIAKEVNIEDVTDVINESCKEFMSNYIPKQVVRDKVEELNKEIKNGDEIEAIFKIKQQQILQELLEGRNENG